MSTPEEGKAKQTEIRQSLAITDLRIPDEKRAMPKQRTARLKVINGRPYYYEIKNVWDPKEKRCHQKSKYLGKQLPKGYRLVK